MARNVTLEDLRTGRIARITTNELCMLDGHSRYTHEKNRCQGKGIPFIRDNGRCWYRAEDVLKALDGPVVNSTAEYREEIKNSHLSKLKRNKSGQFKKNKKPAA